MNVRGNPLMHPYHIHYLTPSSHLSKENKLQWIAKISSATSHDIEQHPSWISITQKGIFKNDQELIPSSSFKVCRNPTFKFRINIPESWAIDDEPYRDSEDAPGRPRTGSYRHLIATRMDNLAYCTVSVSDSANFPDDLYNEKWPDLLEFFKEDKQIVMEEGNIYSGDLQGKYVVLKEPSGAIVYKAIYVRDGRRYKLDCSTDSMDNFKVLKDTFREILVSFHPAN